jgi:hypothetical protein
MNRLILGALLCLPAFSGRAQNTFLNLYGGIGSSINYNYDAGTSAGFSFIKFGYSRVGFGAQLFYQGYSFRYDKEANSMHNGTGNAGVMIRDKASYIFLAPKVSTFLTKRYLMEGYLNFGAGFKMSGTETMRKWDRSYPNSIGNYDSTINSSSNLNSMLFRFGVGLNEYAHLGGGRSTWWFSFTEDVGFVTSSITKTSDFNDPSRTQYSPNQKLNPAYFSFQIGIMKSKAVYH